MNRFAAHAILTAALFVSLAGFEFFNGDEPVTLAEFLEDAFEWALLAGAVASASYAIVRLRATLAERNGLTSALTQARIEGNQWRATARTHVEGLGEAIRWQFARWHLTASEHDVAMLMLKGLSHKEIAKLRRSTSATVRQQATAVYTKSGLSCRAELAAFFLEDLFPSASDRQSAVAQSSSGPSYICHRPGSKAVPAVVTREP